MEPRLPYRFEEFRLGVAEPLLLIAGPCVLESKDLAIEIASTIAEATCKLGLQYVFKGSFDKANRTSIDSLRGPGLERGLKILKAVRENVGVPVTTDIHLPSQAAPVAEICELLQIPAFLARQTDLVSAAAETGRAVNVKKGQFMAASDMAHVVGKLSATGCKTPLLCERGTFFGYGRLVNDMTGLIEMGKLAPVVFDATHSVQRPGGKTTGGNREMVLPLAKAAVAVGVSGLFLETHPAPETSPSDGPNMVPLSELPGFLEQIVAIRAATQPAQT